MSPSVRVLHLAEYALVRIVLAVIMSLGFPTSVRVADRLADLYYRLEIGKNV